MSEIPYHCSKRSDRLSVSICCWPKCVPNGLLSSALLQIALSTALSWNQSSSFPGKCFSFFPFQEGPYGLLRVPLCITVLYAHLMLQSILNIFEHIPLLLCHNTYKGQASKDAITCLYSINIFVLLSYLTCSSVFFKQSSVNSFK